MRGVLPGCQPGHANKHRVFFCRCRMNGWVKLHRRLLDSPVWSLSDAKVRVWITILLLANHKDAEWMHSGTSILISRGSFITTQRHLAIVSRTSRQVVRDTLIALTNSCSITTQIRTQSYTQINVVNYDSYQGNDTDENPVWNQERTQREPSENPSGRKEEGKKEKKRRPLPRPLALPESVTWGNSCCLILKYNREAPDNVPSVRSLSEARIDRERRFLRMFPDEAWWTMTFRQYYRSKFLRGHKEPNNGHKSFQPDFDWLLSKGKDGIENCVKVHDGRYCDD